MNILLFFGLLLVTAFAAGWLLERLGLPKIIGYIGTGIFFSPNTIPFIDQNSLSALLPLMQVCLAFIAFEVGGALKWSKIKAHGKEILSITLMASLAPFLLISAFLLIVGILFPALLKLDFDFLLIVALLMGALASPTDPTATFAVVHQYKSKGKVSDTIIGVAALDDAVGILLFSLTLGIASVFLGTGPNPGHTLIKSFFEIGTSIGIGLVLGFIFPLISRYLKLTSEGQWVVIVFSLLIFGTGISIKLGVDLVLTSMTMGIIATNFCQQEKMIFSILQRYTEEIIFLFFFLLSGLYLDISTLQPAFLLIMIFIVLRTAGKYLGVQIGAKLVKANRSIQKHAAGGLIPQGGIVIGLVLSIYSLDGFQQISELLLPTIMGTTVIHELLGPIAARHSLIKAGEIKSAAEKQDIHSN